MKKHWKKIVSIFLVLILAVGGYFLYEFKFKTYDTADKKVEKITKSKYDIQLPGEEDNGTTNSQSAKS